MHRSIRLIILVLAWVQVQHTCALQLQSNTPVRVGYTCTLYCVDDTFTEYRPDELNTEKNFVTRLSRGIFGEDASIELVLLPRNGLVNGTIPNVNLIIGIGWFLSEQYVKLRTESQPLTPIQPQANAGAFAAAGRPVILTWDGEAFDHQPGFFIDSSKYDIMLTPSRPTLEQFKFTEAVYVPFSMMAQLMRNKHTFNDLTHPARKDVTRLSRGRAVTGKSNFCAFMYRKCWIKGVYSPAAAVRIALFHTFADKYKACTSFRSPMGSNDGCPVGSGSPTTVPTRPDENYYDSAVTNYDGYKFVLVAEHDRKDGYVTEKIFNAMLAGAVPIYFGAPDIESHVNPARFINCNFDVSDLKHQPKGDLEALVQFTRNKYSVELDKCVEEVRRLENNATAFEYMLNQPAVLPGQFDLESYANRIWQIYNHLQVPSN